jgi:hypothetical protein
LTGGHVVHNVINISANISITELYYITLHRMLGNLDTHLKKNKKSCEVSPKMEPIILPNIHEQQSSNYCFSCNVRKTQGCSNTIIKNGSKIWYVLHNLVESIKTSRINREEFEITCTAILAILKSMPCKICAGYSISWYHETVANNVKLYDKIHFMYEVWKHHDDVNKRILIMFPDIILTQLSWKQYMQQFNVNKITCTYDVNKSR